MTHRPRLAVVGCGEWGPNLVRNLYENPQCGPLTCCDLDAGRLERMKTRFPATATSSRYQDVLADPDIEGILLATPVSTHFQLGRQALEAGKHLFVEKPLAARATEARELVDLADQRRRALMVGHTFVYSPAVRKIKEYVGNGDLGQIYFISSSRVNLGAHQSDASVIWDLAPHDLSMFFYWLEELPTSVSATGRACVQKEIADVAFVHLRFASGVIAHAELSWLAPSKLRRTVVVGARRMLLYDDTETTEKIKLFDRGVSLRDPETFGEFQLSYRLGDILSPHLDPVEPLALEMDDFLRAITTGASPLADGYSGLKAVLVMEAAERSLQNGGREEVIDGQIVEGPAGSPRR